MIQNKENDHPNTDFCLSDPKQELSNFRNEISSIKNDFQTIEIPCNKKGFKIGKWTQDEHLQFLRACDTYGNNWVKIQGELKSRSPAQLRSHAQKYIIKLCKRYQIKIKSKKFTKKISKHLINVNKRKTYQFNEMNELEKKLLNTFNYYNREYKPFTIHKHHRNHEATCCIREILNKKIKRANENKIFKVNKIKRESEKESEINNFPQDFSIPNFDTLYLTVDSNRYLINELNCENYEMNTVENAINSFLEYYNKYNIFLNGIFPWIDDIKNSTQIFFNLLNTQNKNWNEVLCRLSTPHNFSFQN